MIGLSIIQPYPKEGAKYKVQWGAQNIDWYINDLSV